MSWGLTGERQNRAATQPAPTPQRDAHNLPTAKISRLTPLPSGRADTGPQAKAGVEKIIEDALRAAGLMR